MSLYLSRHVLVGHQVELPCTISGDIRLLDIHPTQLWHVPILVAESLLLYSRRHGIVEEEAWDLKGKLPGGAVTKQVDVPTPHAFDEVRVGHHRAVTPVRLVLQSWGSPSIVRVTFSGQLLPQ